MKLIAKKYFPIFLLLVLFGCAPINIEIERHWHRYYEPIETPELLSYVSKVQRLAESDFGPPLLPVQDLHIRQSIRRKNPVFLARADVQSWELLIRNLSLQEQKPASQHLYPFLSPTSKIFIAHWSGQNSDLPNVTEQIQLVKDLNAFIATPAFYDAGYMAPYIDPHQKEVQQCLRKKACAELNRKLLEKMIPSAFRPYQKKKFLRQKFELCDVVDKEKGVFVLYTSVPPTSPAFKLQLAHEIFHTLNPYIYDWYMEGLCSVFAEQVAGKLGLNWEPWEELFEKEVGTNPYAASYYMMREVTTLAGEDIKNILLFTGPVNEAGEKMFLDMEAWLQTVPSENQRKIMAVIKSYSKTLVANRQNDNIFIIPGENHIRP